MSYLVMYLYEALININPVAARGVDTMLCNAKTNNRNFLLKK